MRNYGTVGSRNVRRLHGLPAHETGIAERLILVIGGSSWSSRASDPNRHRVAHFRAALGIQYTMES